MIQFKYVNNNATDAFKPTQLDIGANPRSSILLHGALKAIFTVGGA